MRNKNNAQRSLRLGLEAELEVLWERFPARGRKEVVAQYARLIARAARSAEPSMTKEAFGEHSTG